MSLIEAEHYITEAGKTKNLANKGRLIQRAKRYLRFNEREERQAEVRRINEMLSRNNPALEKMGSISIQQAAKYKSSLEQDIEENSPPEKLDGVTKDALVKESKTLEDFIKEGMLTHEEMRRNNVGATDRHMKWEKSKKDAILKWKNIQLLLNPDSNEQDLANVERLRPSMLPQGGSTFMVNAQIPGVFPVATSEQAKANFEQTFPESPTVNTPLKQLEDQERKELLDRISKLENELKAGAKKKERTKQSRERQSQLMKERWAKKKAAQVQG